jgi:hypothetical protein
MSRWTSNTRESHPEATPDDHSDTAEPRALYSFADISGTALNRSVRVRVIRLGLLG